MKSLINKITLFNTPGFNWLFKLMAILSFKLTGWKIVGDPPKLNKFVLLGVPHTSNWDFVIMMLCVLVMRVKIHWMGKHTLFRFPFGVLMRWMGGIAIDRSQAHGVMNQSVESFEQTDSMVMMITPEGTRKKVTRWKSGFYHIAYRAKVPIVLGYVDYAKKITGFGPVFYPTGDIKQDLPKIQEFYKDKTAKHPGWAFD